MRLGVTKMRPRDVDLELLFAPWDVILASHPVDF